MQVIRFATGLRWGLVLLLLAVGGMSFLHAPRGVPPTDAGDGVDEEFHQQLRAMGNAMADAYKRGDKEAGEQWEVAFRQVMADYGRHFRERHPLPDPRVGKRSRSIPTPCDPYPSP
jgi:hypothetical protein